MKQKLYQKKEECCGCSACAQICPQKCIHMIPDAEGFCYPRIDESKCVHCNACARVCPLKNQANGIRATAAYAMLHHDEAYRLQCTSAGAFEVICKNFCQNMPCAVFGVIMDSDFRVKHTEVTDLQDIRVFRKSKYVQSDMQDVYRQVRMRLAEGRRVVFSGSPCQVDGLKHFLKTDNDRLLTVDFVCHGVPSQRVFDKYTESISQKHGSPLSQIEFRHKVPTDSGWNCLGMKYVFANGDTQEDLYPPCAYMEGFLTQLYIRPSCHYCSYASMERHSDITLGDSWGMDDFSPELSMRVTNGTSLVMMNTDKGARVFENASHEYDLVPVPLDVLPKAQKQLVEPSKPHRCRNRFFRLLRYLSFDEAKRIATKETRISYYRTIFQCHILKRKR